MLGQCGACVVVVVAATKSIFYHFFLDTLLSLLLSFVWPCFKHTHLNLPIENNTHDKIVQAHTMLTRSSNNSIRQVDATPEWVQQPDEFTPVAQSNGAVMKPKETMPLGERTALPLQSISTEHRYMRSSNSSSSSGGFGSSSSASNSNSSSPRPSHERIMEPGEFDDLVNDKHYLSSADEVDEEDMESGHDAGSSSGDDEGAVSSWNTAKRPRKRPAPLSRSKRQKRPASSHRRRQQKPSKSKSTSNSNSNHHPISMPPITLSIEPEDLKLKRVLGEGQMGMVMLAEYQSVPVACKFRRAKKSKQTFEEAITRELAFAARLSVCPYMNPCIGILRCKQTKTGRLVRGDDLYIVQRYYENGDLRDYMENLQGKKVAGIGEKV